MHETLKEHKTLTEKTISGFNWNFLRNYTKSFVNIIVGILLARLLEPRDFGLLGMSVIFIGFTDLFATLGMGSSVIRLKNLTERHIRTATTITLITSLLLYIIFWFMAPLIAKFYNEPRIIPLLQVLSILFIIKGVTTVSYGLITRKIDFKSILVVELSSFTIGYGLTSCFLALMGFGVWSLVIGRITSAFISSALFLWKVPLNLKLMIGKKEFKELIGFGSGVSISNILLYGSTNIDYLIIGKFLNSHLLGLYTRAFHLMTESISKVTGGIYNVLFPAFAVVQDEPEKLRKAYLRTIKTVSYFIFPVLASSIVMAEFLIKGLYGPNWGGAITSFQILAAGGILKATLGYSGAIAHATGRVYTEVSQQLIYFIILALGAFAGASYGIEGVATAVVGALLWMFIAQSWLAIRIIKSSWSEFFINMVPGIANLVLMIIINIGLYFLLYQMHNVLNEIKLILALFINAISFLFIIVFMPASIKGDTFEWLIQKYKKYFPSKFLQLYFAFNTK